MEGVLWRSHHRHPPTTSEAKAALVLDALRSRGRHCRWHPSAAPDATFDCMGRADAGALLHEARGEVHSPHQGRGHRDAQGPLRQKRQRRRLTEHVLLLSSWTDGHTDTGNNCMFCCRQREQRRTPGAVLKLPEMARIQTAVDSLLPRTSDARGQCISARRDHRDP